MRNKKNLYFSLVLFEPLYFTDLTFNLIYLQKVTGLRDVSSSTHIPWRDHFLPLSKSTMWQDFSSTSSSVTEQEIYSRVNCEYHGLFHPLETEAASAHCFPIPTLFFIWHSKLIHYYASMFVISIEFSNTQSHSPPCMTLSLSQLTYKYISTYNRTTFTSSIF